MADIVDNPYYLRERPLNQFYNLFTKWLLKRADSIRVSTLWEFEKLSTYQQFPQIWNVPFYIDPDRFIQATDPYWRQQLLGNSFDHLILTVGRIATQKNPFTLVTAAQKVLDIFPRTLFVWVGDGLLFQSVQEKIVQLGIDNNIRLMGAVPYKQVPELYKAADIFTIASAYEGTCMVLQEAAHAKLPIVATAFAGANDMIVDGNNGYKVPIEDSAELAMRLCTLLENAELRKRMGESASQRSFALYNKAEIITHYQQMWVATAKKRLS